MKLILKRNATANDTTIGRLYDGETFLCYTLEDAIRTTKIPAQTCIFPGTYSVSITMSNRFKKFLPLLADVPQFSGIRIHAGNVKEDTEGCILLGMAVSANKQSIIQSRVAMKKVFGLIEKALGNKKPVTITIINP